MRTPTNTMTAVSRVLRPAAFAWAALCVAPAGCDAEDDCAADLPTPRWECAAALRVELTRRDCNAGEQPATVELVDAADTSTREIHVAGVAHAINEPEICGWQALEGNRAHVLLQPCDMRPTEFLKGFCWAHFTVELPAAIVGEANDVIVWTRNPFAPDEPDDEPDAKQHGMSLGLR